MAWCPAAINNLSSFEGIHPNVIRVEGLPVAPDKDVKDLERELFLRMQVGSIIGELTVVLLLCITHPLFLYTDWLLAALAANK